LVKDWGLFRVPDNLPPGAPLLPGSPIFDENREQSPILSRIVSGNAAIAWRITGG
jgi:hypothetical protein